MIDKISRCFKEHFLANGKLYAAPGRVNLIGEHTDYNQGFVLPGAINKSFFVGMTPNGTRTCRIYALAFNSLISFGVDDTEAPESPWARYIFGALKEIEKLGRDVGGFDAVVASEIPAGSGLSSSAAFTSVIGTALNDLFHLGLSRMELARVGQMCEHHYIGVRCGIMDQFASLFGMEGELIRLDCRSLDYKYIPFDPAGLCLVLLDTQVKHALASSEYNVRRAECEEGVALLQKSYPQVLSLRDVSLDMLDTCRAGLSPTVYDRCSYVVEENRRVLAACEALGQGDYVQFGSLMFASHEGLSVKYKVSCPELDFLQAFARQYRGVLGARMMGGGFGGCTINLVEKGVLEDFIAESSERYAKKFWKSLRVMEVAIGSGASAVPGTLQ